MSVPAENRNLVRLLKQLHTASARGKGVQAALLNIPLRVRAVLILLQYAGRFRGWEQRIAELRELRRQRDQRRWAPRVVECEEEPEASVGPAPQGADRAMGLPANGPCQAPNGPIDTTGEICKGGGT